MWLKSAAGSRRLMLATQAAAAASQAHWSAVAQCHAQSAAMLLSWSRSQPGLLKTKSTTPLAASTINGAVVGGCMTSAPTQLRCFSTQPGITLEMLHTSDEIAIAQDRHMPFVNRTNEVATMATMLASNAVILREPSTANNLRRIHLLVSSQMFGSGKTAMAQQFIAQLCNMADDDIVTETGQKLTPARKEELDHLRTAVTVSIDVSNVPMEDILRLLSHALRLDNENTRGRSIRSILHEAWATDAFRGKTLFIHFDEAGTLDDEVMVTLRGQVRGALSFWCQDYKNNPDKARVHFYCTGRGGALLALGATGGSNIGTKRIVLQQLQPHHVGMVREALTDDCGLDLHAKQGGLVDEWCGEFDELVQQATAGVPRLILFTMRALHHLRALYPDKVQLDSKEAIAAALDEVYLQLNSLGIIDNEVAGGPVVRSKFLLPWLWLQLVAKVGAWVNPTCDLPFEGLGLVSPTLDRILGDVPFFAAQHHDGKIKLGRAGFAEVAARATICDKLGAGADAVYDWQLLERRVVAALRLLVAVAHHSRQTWGEVCSFLDHNDVPKDVREERVLVPDCGMLAPVQELSEVLINPTAKQQATLARQLSAWPQGTVMEAQAGSSTPDVAVIGGSFNLYVQCRNSKPGSTTQLHVKDVAAELAKSLKMGKGIANKRHKEGPTKHQVLVVCSTQQPDTGLQELLDRSMAETQPNPRSDQPVHAMAVLNTGDYVVNEGVHAGGTLTVPEHWTLVVLGVDASHQLSSLGAAALQFVMVEESVRKPESGGFKSL